MKSDSPFAPRIAILAALLIWFGSSVPNLWAGSNVWTSIGPGGGINVWQLTPGARGRFTQEHPAAFSKAQTAEKAGRA